MADGQPVCPQCGRVCSLLPSYCHTEIRKRVSLRTTNITRHCCCGVQSFWRHDTSVKRFTYLLTYLLNCMRPSASLCVARRRGEVGHTDELTHWPVNTVITSAASHVWMPCTVKISTDILWRVFHILTEPVPYTFASVNRRNNEARAPQTHMENSPQNICRYTDFYRILFTVCSHIINAYTVDADQWTVKR